LDDWEILKIIFTVTVLVLYVGQRLPTAWRNWEDRRAISPPLSAPLAPQAPPLSKEEQQERIRLERKAYFKSIYADANFVNRNTTQLKDFVINDQINGYDLHKLAELNETSVQFLSGWKKLALDLLRELDAAGWDRKARMKEKWGELRFSVGRNADEKLFEITEKYLNKSLKTCHLCGQPGKLREDIPYWQVLCEKHNESGGAPMYSENESRLTVP
jgi:hypothetical protein